MVTFQCPAKGKRCSHHRKYNHFKVCTKRLGSVKEVQYTQREVAKNHDPQSAQMSTSDDDSEYCYSVKSDHFVGARARKHPIW